MYEGDMGSFRVVGRFLWIIVNNFYCIPTYALWMVLLLPLRYAKPTWYWKVEAVLYEWLLNMVAAWNWSAKYNGEYS
jgi:lysophosphatidylglycerol acyltransferase 1